MNPHKELLPEWMAITIQYGEKMQMGMNLHFST